MIEFKIGDRVKWPGGWEGVITEIGVGPWAAEGKSDDGHRLWAGHLSQLSPIASPEATSREQRGVSGVEARRGWQTMPEDWAPDDGNFWRSFDHGQRLQLWTGCLACARPEPHEHATAAEFMEREFGVGHVSENDVRSLRDEFVSRDTIASEASLARAIFIAENWGEVVKRAELSDPVMGEPTIDRCAEYAAVVQRVVSVMWSDEAYASQREHACTLAACVWGARAGVPR